KRRSDVTFANPLPWWVLTLVLSGAAALSWLAYWRALVTPTRRLLLSGVRFVTLAAIVVLLMRPVARSSQGDATHAVVPILIDVSRSMSIEDAGGLRRIDRARQMLESEILPALEGRFRADVLSFGAALSPATPQSLTASASRSDLAGALQDTAERYRGRA